MNDISCDVLVIGAGPAGIAAACTVAENGQDVILVDNNPQVGGQIWRAKKVITPNSKKWFNRLANTNVKIINGAQVFAHANHCLFAETQDATLSLKYKKLILATGATERFIPFPGWTLPGVVGVGGIQALVKNGFSVKDKRIVIAGSGPLLLTVAAYLKINGANVLAIAEQASVKSLIQFGSQLLYQPSKLWQSAQLGFNLRGIKFSANTIPVRANGDTHITSVTLRKDGKEETLDCDLLATGFYLVPNTRLARLLGCEQNNDSIITDEFQHTSVPNIYCAGEVTGIGGVDVALVEGEIAGFTVVGKREQAENLFNMRRKHQSFANALNRTFNPSAQLKALPQPDTIICRCEDVTHEQLEIYSTWRSAKLETRCGMGACQGRICGPSVQFLYNWEEASIRPPLYPVRTESLLSLETGSAQIENSQ